MKLLKLFSENWQLVLALITLSPIARHISLYFQVVEQEKSNRLKIEADKDVEILKEKNRHQEKMSTLNFHLKLSNSRSKFK